MTFADGGLGSGSLRDAVLQFNADSGTDDDIIQLSAGTYHLTIPNAGGQHENSGPHRRPEPDPDQPPLDHPGGRDIHDH
jgi:hypothetical protein